MNSDSFNRIFIESIKTYHVKDDVDQTCPNPYQASSLEYLLYQKNWIDTVQWHLEDLIRAENINPAEALQIKRRIDASNQFRTDIVEKIDDYYFEQFAHIQPNSTARINTETPAWALDRLSILNLKIYHMHEEANRKEASDSHRDRCELKLKILLQQQKDLSLAINQLLEDVAHGNIIIKTYKQMKMYNDPTLNPVLRKTISI
jgi:hypothetical protein